MGNVRADAARKKEDLREAPRQEKKRVRGPSKMSGGF